MAIALIREGPCGGYVGLGPRHAIGADGAPLALADDACIRSARWKRLARRHRGVREGDIIVSSGDAAVTSVDDVQRLSPTLASHGSISPC